VLGTRLGRKSVYFLREYFVRRLGIPRARDEGLWQQHSEWAKTEKTQSSIHYPTTPRDHSFPCSALTGQRAQRSAGGLVPHQATPTKESSSDTDHDSYTLDSMNTTTPSQTRILASIPSRDADGFEGLPPVSPLRMVKVLRWNVSRRYMRPHMFRGDRHFHKLWKFDEATKV